jgi:hypothetical protein
MAQKIFYTSAERRLCTKSTAFPKQQHYFPIVESPVFHFLFERPSHTVMAIPWQVFMHERQPEGWPLQKPGVSSNVPSS